MIKWGIVTSISPFHVRFDGEEESSPRIYKKPSTYTPQLNDRIAFLVIDSQYVCLGKYE